MVTRTDAPISVIALSPAGDRIIGSGYETDEGESEYHFESSGLFVLDSRDLRALTHHPPGQSEQAYWPITFSNDAGVAYVSSWVGHQRIDAVDLASGEVLATAENPEFLDMIGPIEVLASTR